MRSAMTVLITGCSGGFGRLTAELLTRQGYRVFAGIRDSRGRNAGAAAELTGLARREGLALTVVELDVTDEVSVSAAVTAAGRVDALVNNAGVLAVGVAEAFTPDQLRAVFEANLLGPHRVARAVLPGMRERGSGLIVQVSSILGRCTLPLHGVYCASKAALEALAEATRDELVGSGVEVAVVEPGPYPTAIAGKIVGPADPARSAGYPATAGAQLNDWFGRLFDAPDRPDPREVAQAIARLVALPSGTRPFRTVVGRALAETEAFNSATAAFRSRALAEIGLSELPGAPGTRPLQLGASGAT